MEHLFCSRLGYTVNSFNLYSNPVRWRHYPNITGEANRAQRVPEYYGKFQFSGGPSVPEPNRSELEFPRTLAG